MSLQRAIYGAVDRAIPCDRNGCEHVSTGHYQVDIGRRDAPEVVGLDLCVTCLEDAIRARRVRDALTGHLVLSIEEATRGVPWQLGSNREPALGPLPVPSANRSGQEVVEAARSCPPSESSPRPAGPGGSRSTKGPTNRARTPVMRRKYHRSALERAAAQGKVSRVELAEVLEISTSNASRVLAKLGAAGMLRRVGFPPASHWVPTAEGEAWLEAASETWSSRLRALVVEHPGHPWSFYEDALGYEHTRRLLTRLADRGDVRRELGPDGVYRYHATASSAGRVTP